VKSDGWLLDVRFDGDKDLLTWEDATGKGGHHRIYTMELSRPEFARKVIDKFLETLKTIKDQEKVFVILLFFFPKKNN